MRRNHLRRFTGSCEKVDSEAGGEQKVLSEFGENVQGRVDLRIQILGQEKLAVMKWGRLHYFAVIPAIPSLLPL